MYGITTLCLLVGSTSAESPAGCSSDDVKRFLSYFRNRLLDDVVCRL
jgi:hypothetical protein